MNRAPAEGANGEDRGENRLFQRVLLANIGMGYRGGTQAWVRQIHGSLSGDHEVHLFSGDGEYDGITPFDPAVRYDLALVNHWGPMRALRKARIGKRIFTSHGVLPFAETPVAGADAYVGVSEAVIARIPQPAALIRNPIDFAHFRPERPLPSAPGRVAFVSNRQGEARHILEEACAIAGLELRVVGRETAVADPQPIYQWADIVVGIARVAVEALAAGRNVMCFDYQGYHGMAQAQALPRLWESNFGGHALGMWPTPVAVANALINEYSPVRDLRPQLREQHDPDRVVRSYLELAASTPRSLSASLARRGPRQLMSPKVTLIRRRLAGITG